MNHTFVKDGINIFLEDFSYLADNYPALDLVMGESGRFTDNESSSDLSQDIFGSALWTADYLLYLMTLVHPPALSLPYPIHPSDLLLPS